MKQNINFQKNYLTFRRHGLYKIKLNPFFSSLTTRCQMPINLVDFHSEISKRCHYSKKYFW